MLKKKRYGTMLKKMAAVAIGIAACAMSASGQAFPNYSGGTSLSLNQVYQASSNGFIVVTAIGSYENTLSIYVGATSPPTTYVWGMGDDINSNTKASSAIVPIMQGTFYQIRNPGGVPYVESTYGFEWVTAYFYPANGGTTNTSLWVTSGNNTYETAGNVGIGTTNPVYPLDVAGQIRTSSGGVVFPDGTTQTTAFLPANCGADYAEAVDVSGDRTSYGPGDLLVIDSDAPGKFLKSNQPYSTLIAGVFSTKPGFVGRLQLATPSDVPLAMVGRVPTKVSAENGPIKVGDLLVSSSTPGYAMKATDRSRMFGAVIGKALGSLDSGTGTIMVLVTLQ